MEGDTFSHLVNGTQFGGKISQTFQKSFVQVQNILDQNRLLINEINQNHESKIPDNLSRNAGDSSGGGLKSDGKASHKRHIPG